MLKKITFTPNSILTMPMALYLGYTFFDLFIKSFFDASFAPAGILLCGVGFFMVIRWLSAETPQAKRVKTKGFHVGRCATVPKVFALWEASTARYQAKAQATANLTGQKMCPTPKQ